MAEEPPESVAIPLVWVGVDEVPAFAVNQALIQHSAQDEFTLTFGLLTPPVLLGSDEQKAEQAKSLNYVAIKAVSRVAFNRQRAEELIRILSDNLATHDQKFKGAAS